MLQKLHASLWESNSNRDQLPASQANLTTRTSWHCGGEQFSYKSHTPKHDFPSFEGEDVYKWLYKCNQYFEVEEIQEFDKLKLTSYYLDGMTLYKHQKFMRSRGVMKVS